MLILKLFLFLVVPACLKCNNLLNPEKAKRPWLSMIRQLTKIKYNMVSSDYRIKQQGKKDIRTKQYVFSEK